MNTLSERFLLLGLVSLILIFACEKWDFDNASFTNVITVGALEVGFNSAFLLGDIEDLRNARIIETGFIVSESAGNEESLRLNQSGVKLVISPSPDSVIVEDRAFAARVTDLNTSTRYFFRAYIRLDDNENAYGSIDTFTTSSLIISAPTIRRTFEGCFGTLAVVVSIEGARTAPDQNFGIVWSNNEDDMYASIESGRVLQTTELGQAGNIQLNLSVECSTTYYLRGYYQANNEVTYGPVSAFTTLEGGLWIERPPFPGERRSSPVIFAIGDQGYLGGGSQLEPDLNDLWTFEEQNSRWTSLGDFDGLDVREATTLTINGKAYIFGGLRSPRICNRD